MSKNKLHEYAAVVQRTIKDEIVVKVTVMGEMEPFELQKNIEKIAEKAEFNHLVTNLRVDAQVICIELIEDDDGEDEDD